MRIKGQMSSRQIWIDGKELTPGESFIHVYHSPDGFCWGYGGSGPAQLAFAILLDVTRDPGIAFHFYQEFKMEHVAQWPPDFEIDIDIFAWIRTKGATHEDRGVGRKGGVEGHSLCQV